jgi:hypothetical protein
MIGDWGMAVPKIAWTGKGGRQLLAPARSRALTTSFVSRGQGFKSLQFHYELQIRAMICITIEALEMVASRGVV